MTQVSFIFMNCNVFDSKSHSRVEECITIANKATEVEVQKDGDYERTYFGGT